MKTLEGKERKKIVRELKDVLKEIKIIALNKTSCDKCEKHFHIVYVCCGCKNICCKKCFKANSILNGKLYCEECLNKKINQ